jgi:hypothetical protein
MSAHPPHAKVEKTALGAEKFVPWAYYERTRDCLVQMTDDGYPAAGPFISRAYVCPSANRTFFVDAWLYLPDVDRPKHEYMIQLRTLLDTFRCAGSTTASAMR